MTDRQSVRRLLCFVACIPSGAALLAKVYGLASVQSVTLYGFLPGMLLVGALWWSADNPSLAARLEIGAWGGLLGTIAYDVFRLPFHLLGIRIYSPIDAYGVWLADAELSDRFTSALGWSYHFSNGVTFGVMFALVMAGSRKATLYAILWALVLETIAIVSPLGPLFGFTASATTLAIAYLGHVAYGIPLGSVTRSAPAISPRVRRGLVFACAVGAVAAAILILNPASAARDARAAAGRFEVEDGTLNPGWLRIERGSRVEFHNGGAAQVHLVGIPGTAELAVAAGETVSATFAAPGIARVYVAERRPSVSSFVMVEPVEEAP